MRNAAEIKRIAIAYEEAKDEIKKIPREQIHLFRKLIKDQFNFLTSHHSSRPIYFDFVLEDPYEYIKVSEMLADFELGSIGVNCSGNDSKLWGPVYNLFFRAIHEWIHCNYKLDFNYEHEVEAFRRQMEFSTAGGGGKIDWDLYEKVLRSEIVYQAAYKTHFNVFHLPFQKIILADL